MARTPGAHGSAELTKAAAARLAAFFLCADFQTTSAMVHPASHASILPSVTIQLDPGSHCGDRRIAPLKFSTGGDYFNAESGGFKDTTWCGNAICKKKRLLQRDVRSPSLATALHRTAATPARANQTRGHENGKEDLEESKEDRSNEAVDGSQAGLSFLCGAWRLTLLQERGVKALQRFSLGRGWCRRGAALFESSRSRRYRQQVKGDWIMAKNAKPVKGKKSGNVKPLMKRADLPGIKPLIRFQ